MKSNVEKIKFNSYDRFGDIAFSIGKNKYTYNVDAGFFNTKEFQQWSQHSPGKLLNWAKKYGRLISKSPITINSQPQS